MRVVKGANDLGASFWVGALFDVIEEVGLRWVDGDAGFGIGHGTLNDVLLEVWLRWAHWNILRDA